MSWLKNKINRWLREEVELGNSNKYSTIGSSAVEKGHSNSIESEPIRLKIFRATGGLIIETQTYDRKTDNRNTKLHIVNNDSDMGDSISKIITMESLRG